MRFGKNNKVVPLVMQSVQNGQSLRTSQQLAIGTLKVVSSEQRLGERRTESLVRLGKRATEIDLHDMNSAKSDALFAVNLER